jgi:hypothetical protein
MRCGPVRQKSVADKEHFFGKQNHSHGGIYWQVAESVLTRHTVTPHPAKRQVVPGNLALVSSRCRFEATGRYAGFCLTKKYSLTAPDSQVINRNIFLVFVMVAVSTD